MQMMATPHGMPLPKKKTKTKTKKTGSQAGLGYWLI
jgi:hypothetical protein